MSVTVVKHFECQVEKRRRVQTCERWLAELGGSLWPPPLLSNSSPCCALALLFRAMIGQAPPAELVCSSFVAPRFHSLLKASLWRDVASAASPSSFTLLRLRAHTQFCSPPSQTLPSRVTTEVQREQQQRDTFNGVPGTLCVRVAAVGPKLCLPRCLQASICRVQGHKKERVSLKPHTL